MKVKELGEAPCEPSPPSPKRDPAKGRRRGPRLDAANSMYLFFIQLMTPPEGALEALDTGGHRQQERTI